MSASSDRIQGTWLLTSLSFPFALIVWNLFFISTAIAQPGAQTASVDLDQLVQSAATILRGHVVSATLEPHPQFSNLQTIFVTIAVGRVLKGQTAPTYTFRQFVWDEHDDVAGGYLKSGELLLFLNPVSPYGLTSPVGLEQGRFRILRDTKGTAYAVNGRSNLGLFNQVQNKASSRGVSFSRQAQAMLAKSGGQVSLESLEDAIVSLVGTNK